MVPSRQTTKDQVEDLCAAFAHFGEASGEERHALVSRSMNVERQLENEGRSCFAGRGRVQLLGRLQQARDAAAQEMLQRLQHVEQPTRQDRSDAMLLARMIPHDPALQAMTMEWRNASRDAVHRSNERLQQLLRAASTDQADLAARLAHLEQHPGLNRASLPRSRQDRLQELPSQDGSMDRSLGGSHPHLGYRANRLYFGEQY